MKAGDRLLCHVHVHDCILSLTMLHLYVGESRVIYTIDDVYDG